MLKKILADCRENLAAARHRTPLSDRRRECRRPRAKRSLKEALLRPGFNLIAEIKGASPSHGRLRKINEPAALAAVYEAAGAAAVSVLTEPKYFHGRLEYLAAARRQVKIPVLRKDFIFDEYQLYEARAYEADAVLLMTSVVREEKKLSDLIDLAHHLDMEVLLEVSDEPSLESAESSAADVIGINNRDFQTLKTDLDVTFKLMGKYEGDKPIISESGIFTAADAMALKAAGVNGMLVGTALVQSNDITAKIQELIGIGQTGGENYVGK